MKSKRFNKYISIILFSFLFLLIFTGCGIFIKKPPEIKETALIRINSSDHPDFFDDMEYDSLEDAILGSISYLNRVPPTKTFRFGQDIFNTPHMIKSLEHFLHFIRTKPSKDELIQFIKENYLIYTTMDNDNSGQVFLPDISNLFYEDVLTKTLNINSQFMLDLMT